MRTPAALAAGALTVGSLDGTFAASYWAVRGVPPTRVFQSVAAGLLGRDAALHGGVRTALLGLALHYFIATCIVIVYWLASRRIRALVEHPFVCGAMYGIGVYIVMNYVVIPLSATTKSRFNFWWVFWSVVVHAFLIGVPAALSARAALSHQPRQSASAERA